MARHRDLPSVAGGCTPPPSRAASRRDRAWGGRLRPGGQRRPARDDRFLLVRSVDLLRDRQRRCVYVACFRWQAAARAECLRPDRMPAAGRHLAVAIRGCGADCVRCRDRRSRRGFATANPRRLSASTVRPRSRLCADGVDCALTAGNRRFFRPGRTLNAQCAHWAARSPAARSPAARSPVTYSPAARETRAKRLSGPHASRTAATSSATSKSSSNSTAATSMPLSRNAFNVSSPVSG